MNFLTPFVISLSALLLIAPGAESQQTGRGRTAPQPARSPDSTAEIMRVIALKNASSASVAHVLSELGFTIVSDGSTNSIIVNGTLEKLDTLQALIAKLDVPTGGPISENLAMIPVRHRPTQELASHIMSLGASRNARVAADTARSMILVSGPEDVLTLARNVVEALDTPARSVVLDFAFFQANVGGSGAADNIPDDLTAVADELARFGFVQLLGRMSTSCVEDEEFDITGELKSRFVCEVEGKVLTALDGGSIKLRMQARLGLESQADTDGQIKRAVFEVETTVVTQSGDIVVLGSAPAGLEEGQSVILVLRVHDNAPA